MTSKASFSLKLRPCSRCGHPFPDDKGRCPSCRQWNTDSVRSTSPALNLGPDDDDGTCLLSEVTDETDKRRLVTGPWDEVFGGMPPPNRGIVDVSTNLLGGAPGAGKSTMALQLSNSIARSRKGETFYVAAEEAKADVNERARRLSLDCRNLIRIYPMGCASDLGSVLLKRRPKAIVIDSLPGLVGDDHAAAMALCKNLKGYAVELGAPVIIIDHVTKEDDFAGLRKLQHEVDATMTLFPVELDQELANELDFSEIDIAPEKLDIRELSNAGLKNRNGPVNISVYFAMTETGLVYIPKASFSGEDDDE